MNGIPNGVLHNLKMPKDLPPKPSSYESDKHEHNTKSGIPIAGPGSPKIMLSLEQKVVLERVQQGRSVFFTGSAGMHLL
jgi:hypothetical protein